MHKCNFCEMNFNSEKSLTIHVGKSHKSIDSTPEKGGTPSKPFLTNNISLSHTKEARDESTICPSPED